MKLFDEFLTLPRRFRAFNPLFGWRLCWIIAWRAATISLRAQPANNNFTNAQVLPGPAGSVSGSTVNSTKEPGEPNHDGNAGGRSIWYRWTALRTEFVTFDTIGSTFDSL